MSTVKNEGNVREFATSGGRENSTGWEFGNDKFFDGWVVEVTENEDTPLLATLTIDDCRTGKADVMSAYIILNDVPKHQLVSFANRLLKLLERDETF